MRVVVKTETETDHFYHDGQQYGDWSASHSFYISDVKVVDEDYKTEYGEEGYLIADGSTNAYVLYMRYGSGDSFGHSSGNGEVLCVFGNKENAEAAYEAVKKNKDQYSIKIKDDLGREISLYNPGSGYFEHVEELTVATYSIDEDNLKLTEKF